MGWRMSRKLHVLHCHLNVFKGKMRDYYEEQGERFHQEFLKCVTKAKSVVNEWWVTTYGTSSVTVTCVSTNEKLAVKRLFASLKNRIPAPKSRNLQSYCTYRLSQYVSLGSDLVFVFSCRPLSSSLYFEELFLFVFGENKYRSLLCAFISIFWIQPKLRVPKSTPWRVSGQLYSSAERRIQDCGCWQCKVQYFYGLGNRTWKHYHRSQTPPKLQQGP